MGSGARKGQTALHKVVKQSAYWFWDWLAGQAIAAAITIFLFSLGIGYMVDDDRIEQATVVAAKQAGSSDLADGYHAFWKATDDAKKSVLARFPDDWHEPLKRWSMAGAGLVLGAALTVLLLRAPTRAHALKEVGWGIAVPGVLAAFATLVLEWRAMKGIKATIAGERSASTLWSEGKDAAIEGLHVLWPVLLGGAVAVVIGIVLERRWRKGGGTRRDGTRLAPQHVLSHFLIVAGAVPWAHYGTAIVLDAFTEGSSTGASMAPFTTNPLVYVACSSLFGFGAALYVIARAEVKKLEAREAAAAKG